MKNTKIIVLTVFALMLITAPSVHARLAAVGPTNPATGFPLWYQDQNAVRLVLCTDAARCPIDPTGVESFYFDMVAKAGRAPAPNATMVLAVEATYLNGVVVPGEEITFSRMRILVKNLPAAGIYTVNHPFGVNTFNVRPDAKGLLQIKFTQDVGGLAPGLFRGAIAGKVGPFLKQIPSPPGFMGNINVARPITPGPGGAAFTVTGPTGIVINQTRWAVAG